VEEIAAAVVQVFVEFFLEFAIYVGIDVVSYQTERSRSYGCMILGLIALAGMGLGGVVNWMHPQSVLPYLWLRLLNLIGGPLLAGGLSAAIARWRGRDPWFHFWMAFCFVLGYNLVRFAYAHV
jgi:hypothetical protein